MLSPRENEIKSAPGVEPWRARLAAVHAELDAVDDDNDRRQAAGLPPKPYPRVSASALQKICADIRAGRRHPHDTDVVELALIRTTPEDYAAYFAALESWLTRHG